MTALLAHALKSGMVDGVFAVRKGADVYDALPALITDPAEIGGIAGSLHCGTLLLPKTDAAVPPQHRAGYADRNSPQGLRRQGDLRDGQA